MKKIIKKIVVGIFALFLILNLVWLWYWFQYKNYRNAVGYDEQSDRYFYTDADGYRYAVFSPDYLRFEGNLTVGNVVWVEDQNECMCSLIIWPLFTGGYEYGIMIYVPVEDENGYTYESYNIMMDETGEPLSEDLTENEFKLIEKNKDLIDTVYKKAYDMWEFE